MKCLSRCIRSIFDDDGDGSLSYPEFLAFIQLQQYQLVRAFAVLDSNHTGKSKPRDSAPRVLPVMLFTPRYPLRLVQTS